MIFNVVSLRKDRSRTSDAAAEATSNGRARRGPKRKHKLHDSAYVFPKQSFFVALLFLSRGLSARGQESVTRVRYRRKCAMNWWAVSDSHTRKRSGHGFNFQRSSFFCMLKPTLRRAAQHDCDMRSYRRRQGSLPEQQSEMQET